MTVFTHYRNWIISLFTALLFAISASGAYYYIFNRQYEAHLLNASHHYEQLIHTTDTTIAIPLDKANEFIKQYANTPYVSLVQLQLAKQAVQQNQFKEAIEWLKIASQNTKDPAIRAISKQRGARILSTLGEFKEALTWLNEIDCKEYAASTEEIKGDIFLASGQKEKAREAYQNTCEIDPDLSSQNALLQVKMADLDAL